MFSAGFWLPLGNTEKAGFATFDHMNAAFPNRIHAAPNTAYKASLARACQKGIYVACQKQPVGNRSVCCLDGFCVRFAQCPLPSL